MLEKDIEKAILQYLNYQHDCFAFKNETKGTFDPIKKTFRRKMNKFNINGVSDIIALHKSGATLFLEVKTEKGRLSDNQKKFQKKCKEYNQFYFVVRSVLEVEEILKKIRMSNDRNRDMENCPHD